MRKGTQHNSSLIGVNHPWIKSKDLANSRGKYIGKLEGTKGGWAHRSNQSSIFVIVFFFGVAINISHTLVNPLCDLYVEHSNFKPNRNYLLISVSMKS